MRPKEIVPLTNSSLMSGSVMLFVGSYWWRVFVTAFIASAEQVGWKHPKKWPLSIILFAAPLALLAYFAPEQFKSRITLIVAGLAVSISVFSLLMLWNVIVDVPRRAFEAEQLAAFNVQKLTAEIVQLKSIKRSESEKEQSRATLNELISGGNSLLRNIRRQNDAKLVEQLKESCKPWLRSCLKIKHLLSGFLLGGA